MDLNIEKKTTSRAIIFFVVFGGILLLLSSYLGWRAFYSPNIFLKNATTKPVYLYVPEGCDVDCLKNIVLEKATVKDLQFFEWVLKMKNKAGKIYPGKYLMQDKMGNKAFVDMIRPGNRVQVRLTLKFFRKTDDVAEFVANQIQADYDDLVNLLNDNEYLSRYGMTKESVIGLFIPNTYYFNWNTSAKEFLDRMYAEYERFWTDEKKAAAKKMGFTQHEVTTLASIVDRETNWNGEKPTIAGVYINRLRIKMPLQADPTVVFAVNDFTIKRIKKGHLKTASPYNTYVHTGLPPGPICTPAIASINAVLKAEKHNYLYFCAKEDFSGYHNFAATFADHLQYARKFQKAMNANNID